MPRRKGPRGSPHVGLERKILKNESFRSLSGSARTFYLYLKGRYNGSNNGEIRLPYSAMKGVGGCSNPRTISRAIKELESKGWIKVKTRGGLYRHDNYYTLTWKYDHYATESERGRKD